MEFSELMGRKDDFLTLNDSKRMRRIDLEEMKRLQKNISTPASPISWQEIKEIYFS